MRVDSSSAGVHPANSRAHGTAFDAQVKGFPGPASNRLITDAYRHSVGGCNCTRAGNLVGIRRAREACSFLPPTQ